MTALSLVSAPASAIDLVDRAERGICDFSFGSLASIGNSLIVQVLSGTARARALHSGELAVTHGPAGALAFRRPDSGAEAHGQSLHPVHQP
jgi:hypothetical protein